MLSVLTYSVQMVWGMLLYTYFASVIALLEYHNTRFCCWRDLNPAVSYPRIQCGTAVLAQGLFSALKGKCYMHEKQFPFLYLESYDLVQINLPLLVFMVSMLMLRILHFCFCGGERESWSWESQNNRKAKTQTFLWWADVQTVGKF